ncbi:MAG: hypothetical protein O2954_03865 [bacterium]|nr:hypothetical protein [bacterium]
MVGQIIDYAKEISRWTFTDLENHVRAYHREYEGIDRGVLDTLRTLEPIDEDEEAGIVDVISRNLQRGRFLLLIVGDGIRESVEEMAAYLSQTPQLFFTLALVELQVYELKDDSLLVIPQVVTRTREVTRAIVRFEGHTSPDFSVQVDTQEEGGVTRKTILAEEDFFTILGQNTDSKSVDFARQIMADMSDRGCLIEWKKASFVVKLRDPQGSGQNLTLFVVTKEGKMYIGWLPRQLEAVGLSEQIAYDYAKKSARVVKCGVPKGYPDSWDKYPTLKEVQPQFKEFTAVVQDTIDRIQEAARKLDR